MPSTRLRRIFYTAANGDLIGSFQHWRAGAQIAKEVARTYSGELFALCAAHDIDLLGISPFSKEDRIVDGRFDIRHLRVRSHAGARYHLAQLLRSLRILWMILRYRPDVAIISDRLVYWWVLAPLRLLGVRLVIAMHVRLWPPRGARPKNSLRLLLAMDRWFLRHCASGLLAVSRDVATDLGDIPLRAEVFTPLYDPDAFAEISPAMFERDPFHLLFIGRVEANKGVHNLVEALSLALQRSTRPIHLDIAGDGGAMGSLRAHVAQLELGRWVTFHGQLTSEPLLSLLDKSSAVIVPTRSDMGEGYNKVAAEAVLAHRPVIASDNCPILADIEPAAISVSADDIEGYAAAIVRLAEDKELYAGLVAGARSCEQRFFDPERGYAAASRRLFSKLGFTLEPQRRPAGDQRSSRAEA